MEWIRGKDIFLLLIHPHMLQRVLWTFWSLWRLQKPWKVVSSHASTTIALLRIGPGFGSSFGLGISLPAFFCYLCHMLGVRCPQDFAASCTCWKTSRGLGIWGSFSTVLSAPCSPLLAVKAQTSPTKHHWVVVLLEELVNLVAAIPVVLGPSIHFAGLWLHFFGLWIYCLLLLLLWGDAECFPSWGSCSLWPVEYVVQCFRSFFFVGMLLGEPALS